MNSETRGLFALDVQNNLKNYIQLTKPGIVVANAITATAGYFILHPVISYSYHFYLSYIYMLVGVSLIIASAGVINNWIDKDIDIKMSRTKNRFLVVNQSIPDWYIFLYAIILFGIGLIFLYQLPTILPMVAAIIGIFFYIVMYTMLTKRTSIHGTLVGAVSGAMPILVGYLASHDFSFSSFLDISKVTVLFLFMVFWQMAHFFAIAIYIHNDYKEAGVKVISVVKGNAETFNQIVIYIFLFALTVIVAVFIFDITYLGTVLLIGGVIYWILPVLNTGSEDIITKSRVVFIRSIIVITLFSIVFIVDKSLSQVVF